MTHEYNQFADVVRFKDAEQQKLCELVEQTAKENIQLLNENQQLKIENKKVSAQIKQLFDEISQLKLAHKTNTTVSHPELVDITRVAPEKMEICEEV